MSTETKESSGVQELIDRLRESEVELHLAEVKGPVMDQLRRSGLAEKLGEERLFLSTHDAVVALGGDH